MGKIRILFSSNRNPNFETFTDYIEKAFKEEDCEVVFFENRDFIIPGRVRDGVAFLHNLDLKIMNRRLLKIAKDFRPDLFLEDGGWNILPETIQAMKKIGIKTVLWTNDTPKVYESILQSAPFYDYVFTTDSGFLELFAKNRVRNYGMLNFACDPDFHKPITLHNEEMKRYKCDISFVGSGIPEFYSNRRAILEGLTDFNLGVWGPGWDNIPITSPLKRCIRGGCVRPSEWVKIYSASKIALCIHYQSLPCQPKTHQATTKVFEILACGTLLIVDEQQDVLTLFKPGENIIIYKDINELKEKVYYYLKHPNEAKIIAENGRKEILNRHTYRHRIKDMLKTVGLNR